MKMRMSTVLRACLMGSLMVTLSAMAQDAPRQDQTRPQTRPAPGGQQGGARPGGQQPGNRPAGHPGGTANAGARPQQPARPPQGNAQRPPQGTRPPQGNAQRPPQQGNRPPQGNAHRPPQGNRPPQQANRPGGVRPGQRPPQWGRPPANRPTYNFRPNDRNYLRNYYASRLRGINRARRPAFHMGMYFPLAYIGYLQPVPPSMWGMLPAIPPGYQVGYYDGYVVVYDPVTYWIVGVVDLM